MIRKAVLCSLMVASGFTALRLPAIAQQQPAKAAEPQESQVEIYRIAPGQQEAFLRDVAKWDEANKMAGLPPRQLYVHEDGASWDYILIQPAHITPEQSKAVFEAATKLGLPHGHDYFLNIRKYILEHSDTSAEGPTTAADWLSKLKK
jgi:hypothetical protein